MTESIYKEKGSFEAIAKEKIHEIKLFQGSKIFRMDAPFSNFEVYYAQLKLPKISKGIYCAINDDLFISSNNENAFSDLLKYIEDQKLDIKKADSIKIIKLFVSFYKSGSLGLVIDNENLQGFSSLAKSRGQNLKSPIKKIAQNRISYTFWAMNRTTLQFDKYELFLNEDSSFELKH